MDTSNDDTSGDEYNDFFSRLPDPITVRILSLLPIKVAINTLLVRGFGNLWRNIMNLDIDYCQYHNCEEVGRDDDKRQSLPNFIREVLALHDCNTLGKLRLHVYFLRSENAEDRFHRQNAQEQIERLIRYAINKEVKILDLDFKSCSEWYHWNFFELPNVFNTRYLTDLRLIGCDMRLCTQVDLKFLKNLFLEDNSLNEDAMENFLVGCPVLEYLSVIECTLRNLTCNNPSVKKLRVKPDQTLMSVSCPNIKFLEIDGWIEIINLLDASSAVDVSIKFDDHFRIIQGYEFNVTSLLQKFYECKTLSLCDHIILVLSIWNLQKLECPQFLCKNLSLGFGPNKWYFPGLELLLRSAPFIETLTINVGFVFESLREATAPLWLQPYDFEGDTFWDCQEVELPYLVTILVHEYKKEPSMIKLLKFLLRSASKLQKMVISTNKTVNEDGESEFTPQELLDLARELLRLPRASAHAIICFS